MGAQLNQSTTQKIQRIKLRKDRQGVKTSTKKRKVNKIYNSKQRKTINKIKMNNNLKNKTVKQLKKLCRKNNLPTTGIKIDLIHRLTEFFENFSNDNVEEDDWQSTESFNQCNHHQNSDNDDAEDDRQSTESFNQHNHHQNTPIMTNTTMNLRFDDIKSTFKQFRGDQKSCIHQWIQHFDEQSTIFQLSNMQKFIFAKRVMENRAKLFLEYESKATTWPTLKHELIEEFGAELNAATIHQQLSEKKKKPNETSIEYLYEMLAIATTAKIQQKAIITYIIDGLPGSTTSKNFMYE